VTYAEKIPIVSCTRLRRWYMTWPVLLFITAPPIARPALCSQHKAFPEEIEVRLAKHLTPKHLQTVDVPLTGLGLQGEVLPHSGAPWE
jgi:hypothetical protein